MTYDPTRTYPRKRRRWPWAGTYRAVEPVSQGAFDLCMWSKSKDAEGSDLIDMGVPTGGRPQVTLKSGQWFKSQGCPKWVAK